TTITTAAQWDWKRRALTVPLEAFVIFRFQPLHCDLFSCIYQKEAHEDFDTRTHILAYVRA
ncbi:hypothetical protein, partial [Vibrio cholerae]|uniref:hypothetical protein n=1 Tax=Vibrio cholerae TaxID=666 RepID=UPI001C31E0D4